ncbi:MAG: hypothetical protein LUH05_07570, partial [Candidatus Gastranaerophilales bacterium]|nr:hypothetical protein [Candidatus Gastranaerophilales bacterium]
MIIKKKYTTLKKTEENTQPEEKKENVEVNNKEEEKKHPAIDIAQQKIVEKEQEEAVKNEKELLKKKKSIEDLDLSIENIKFEQREERREGTRRRGYRRTQDRNVVSRAQKDAQSIKELARQEGYKEGINAAQKDLEDLRANFLEFFKYKDVVFQKVSDCIIDISVEIARKIINKEIETDK